MAYLLIKTYALIVQTHGNDSAFSLITCLFIQESHIDNKINHGICKEDCYSAVILGAQSFNPKSKYDYTNVLKVFL